MTTGQTRGALFLVHRGAAFIDDLIQLASAHGLEAYVLTSAPPSNMPGREAELRAKSAWLRSTPSASLGRADVLQAAKDLREEGRDVALCLTVWEGYRSFMSEVNHTLGAPDESPARLAHVLDKHRMRMTLRSAGLSNVRSDLLTETWLASAERFDTRKFLKPRRGLASFGAFELHESFVWADLARIQAEMAADVDFNEIFSERQEFVAEDYIQGKEYSFEIIGRGGVFTLIGVHEKVEMREQHGATLECAVVSPPVSSDRAELAAAHEFLSKCLTALGLSSGCFHVEARAHGQRWEVIEINPRVGGSFINHSVRLTTDGECLLDLWLRTLLASTPELDGALRQYLDQRSFFSERCTERESGSFFRVYYGEPGRRISETRTNDIGVPPEIVRVIIPDGTTLPMSSREVFVAQALWRVRREHLHREMSFLNTASNQAIEIRYE